MNTQLSNQAIIERERIPTEETGDHERTESVRFNQPDVLEHHPQRAFNPIALPTQVPRLQTMKVVRRPSLLTSVLLKIHSRNRDQIQPSLQPVAPEVETPETQHLTISKESSGSERREFPRRDSGCLVSVCRTSDGSASSVQQQTWLLHSSRLKGELVDVSMNGVAFILSESIESDEDILLRLSNPRFDKHVDTSAYVIRSIPGDNGQWKIICQFHKKLSFEQVNDFGKHLFQSEFV